MNRPGVDKLRFVVVLVVVSLKILPGLFVLCGLMDKVGKYCDFSSTKFTLAAREDEAGFINVE